MVYYSNTYQSHKVSDKVEGECSSYMRRTDFEPARYALKIGMTVKIDFDININKVLMILYCKGIFISVTIQIYKAHIYLMPYSFYRQIM